MKNAIALLALLTAAASPALAQSSGRPAKTLKYLTTSQIDPRRLLPPPPADGSIQQQHELADVRTIVQTRTAERYAQAIWDNEHENASLFASTLGPGFD